MGGARCSYRTCTTKSDKKTHMFHFPVFDKVRCHQWITNAHKLNFLDLKLSQLKNRVICEHHFTDDAFMNVTKGKLKNTAVPTEDGPFCAYPAAERDYQEIPINLDDIENDYLSNMEKRAHFSVKYGDFLTNDVTESINLFPNHKTTSIKLQDKGMVFNRNNKAYNLRNFKNDLTSCNNALENDVNDTKLNIADRKDDKTTISPLYQTKLLPNPTVVAIEFEEVNLNTNEQNNKSYKTLSTVSPKLEYGQTPMYPCHKVTQSFTPTPSTRKVKIISEKKISEPVKVERGELKTVSPSILIRLPNRKRQPNVELNRQTQQETDIKTLYFDETNLQKAEKIQFDKSGIITSQATDPGQMCLNDYILPTTLVDPIESLSNFKVQDVELHTEGSKPIGRELEMLTDLQHNNISSVPKIDFGCTSSNKPHFIQSSADEPQVSTLLTGNTYVNNVSTAPTEIQNASVKSIDTKMLSVISANTENITGVSTNVQNVSGISKHRPNIVNKKQPSLQNSSSPNKSCLKSKIPPEKQAEIEEKRKFNIKLRDIIGSCLNNLDEEPDSSKLSAAMKRKLNDKKVSEHLSKDPNLPTSQENNIAYLEARLQRMEDTLLNKIEQNSQRITDLKRTIKPSFGKTSAYTQTSLDSETTKRHLYQQLSRFLSPEANSLIYEELFINARVSSDIGISRNKRKR